MVKSISLLRIIVALLMDAMIVWLGVGFILNDLSVMGYEPEQRGSMVAFFVILIGPCLFVTASFQLGGEND